MQADKPLLEDIRNALESQNRIGLRQRGPNATYRLQIGSKRLAKALILLGFSSKKTHRLHWPAIPDPFVPDFVRGYFRKEKGYYQLIYSANSSQCLYKFMYNGVSKFRGLFLNRKFQIFKSANDFWRGRGVAA